MDIRLGSKKLELRILDSGLSIYPNVQRYKVCHVLMLSFFELYLFSGDIPLDMSV